MNTHIIKDMENINRYFPQTNKSGDYKLYRTSSEKDDLVILFCDTKHNTDITEVIKRKEIRNFELAITTNFVCLWICVQDDKYGVDYLSFHLKISDINIDMSNFITDKLTKFIDKNKDDMYKNYQIELERQKKEEFRQNLFSC